MYHFIEFKDCSLRLILDIVLKQGRRTEKIWAQLSSAWHASILDDHNLAVLKNIIDDML